MIPPSNMNEDWLLWYQVRDDTISENVVKLSSGRILFAKSRDGLTNWIEDPASPVLGPNKESGDWFYFDSEHVGLGDIIQPGRKSQSKFTDQGNVFLMYLYGGNGDKVSVVDNGVERTIQGVKMEIGVAVSRDGAHWSRIEGQ